MLKAAIAGCGGIFLLHAESLKAIGVPVIAVCDIVPERAEKYAQEYNCQAFAQYDEMLNAGGFDVLHICLPHYLHAPVAVNAMERGLHVLTEKPMATSVHDAEHMIQTAQAYNVTLGVIFQNRYNPGSVLIKRTLESGRLGKITGGWLRVTWHRDDAYYQHSGWRGKWATEGGGVLINQSIHTFDLMHYFLGGEPLYVEANTANHAHPAIEVEDTAEGVIGYKQTAVSFYVNTIHPYDAPVELELICENGRAKLTGERAVITYPDGREETADRNSDAATLPGWKDYWGVSHIRQLRLFYASLAKGETPEIDGREGLKTQRLINGIYESARTGKRVMFN